ncbi:Fimbrial protein [Vibrio stylophorae]|uniref:Fimbrial protein n=1 Tax=Vibrio stylophorae TaxID=659351 RepID=A0ABM8ZVR5_9VIBR|nr:pilin [Vibrio stylophorae]CAH0534434.1 Fimbrial protein [Vibrio stylophorae]
MKKMQKGFTLIELMIVVAVIGVLAAIAVPQYQDYMKKGAIGSAIATAGAVKNEVEESLAFDSSFPASTNVKFDLGTIAVKGADTGIGTIEVTMTKTSAKNAIITLSRDVDGAWTCSHSLIADGVKVAGCEGAATPAP